MKETTEVPRFNSTPSESWRLMWEELSRRPFIKHKKIFIVSAALGITGLAGTIHEMKYFLEYSLTQSADLIPALRPVLTVPVTATATLYGATFAFFWGLIDEKRTRNENIHRTPEGKLTFKS